MRPLAIRLMSFKTIVRQTSFSCSKHIQQKLKKRNRKPKFSLLEKISSPDYMEAKIYSRAYGKNKIARPKTSGFVA